MCHQSRIREQLADTGRTCENWVICTKGLEAQRSLPLFSSGSQCLWAEWSKSHLWCCKNPRWELPFFSKLDSCTHGFLFFLQVHTAVFHFCTSAHRHSSYQSGRGPSSDPKRVGRCGNPPAQPHNSVFFLCQGAVDGEYIFPHHCIIATCSCRGSHTAVAS